ncbi:MAG: hypothetical protein RLZZ136_277 [Pseudomonadota bacterium]
MPWLADITGYTLAKEQTVPANIQFCDLALMAKS